jgi:DsbC/DsbD-like thiol-disulfide interchange protein
MLAAFSKQRGITFPLLSDAGSAVIKAYGIQNVSAQGAQGGIPHPGTFLIDRAGRVTSRFFEAAYTDRSTVSSMMVRLGTGSAPVAATKISSAQLEMTTFASDGEIAPGNHFSLVVDVTPRPGMHVYAPGASSYRVVSLALAPQPFVQPRPTAYPPSEIYFFQPLNERVPVYQKPFRLVQDVLLEATPEAQKALLGRESLSLTGTVDYQACDDKICYNPVSVPVSWTLKLKPLIRERPQVR